MWEIFLFYFHDDLIYQIKCILFSHYEFHSWTYFWKWFLAASSEQRFFAILNVKFINIDDCGSSEVDGEIVLHSVEITIELINVDTNENQYSNGLNGLLNSFKNDLRQQVHHLNIYLYTIMMFENKIFNLYS
jgi:hypothetical protein